MDLRRIFWSFVVAALVVFVLPVHLPAQVGGTISGLVDDQTGAVLPGATISIKNVETGAVRTVVSDEAGRYYAPNLSLGEYEVRGELSGFSGAVRSGIHLTVG